MFHHVGFVRQVFVKLLAVDLWSTSVAIRQSSSELASALAAPSVLELHDKQRAYHLSIIIKHTSSTEDVLFHFLHTFKVTGTNLNPLIQLTFAVVGLNHKLFHLYNLISFCVSNYLPK